MKYEQLELDFSNSNNSSDLSSLYEDILVDTLTISSSATDYSINLSDYSINLDNMNTIAISPLTTSQIGQLGANSINGGSSSSPWSWNYQSTNYPTTGIGGFHSPYIMSDTNWGALNGNSKLKVAGDAEIDGDLKLKGVSIGDTLAKIEQRLAILRPNSELEERWERLKELGDQYRELEKDILEKEQIVNILKK